VLEFVIFAALVFYLITAVGLFALRVRRPDLPRPVRAIGYPWLPALYVAATGLIALALLVEKTTYSGLGLLCVLIGVPVYFGWRAMVRRAACTARTLPAPSPPPPAAPAPRARPASRARRHAPRRPDRSDTATV